MSDTIVPLSLDFTPAVVARSIRFDHDGLRRHLVATPRLSFIDRVTSDFVIAGPWRNRRHVAVIREVRAPTQRKRLVDAVVDSARSEGYDLILVEIANGSDDDASYRAIGFESIDAISEYAIHRPSILAPSCAVCRWPADRVIELVALDNRSFPWLWWNVPAEMTAYAEGAGVEFWTVLDARSRPCGYVSITSRGFAGYIDRLAVDPTERRRGVGGRLIDQAMYRLVQQGATRIALTTQVDNTSAQSLYTRLGFQPSNLRLTILGYWLTERRDRMMR